LVNAICGKKISIVSDKPQTTRRQVRGILTRPDSQIVFVDTPGLHKPVSALGERVNAAAIESISDVDVACLVLDATMPFGSGDQWVADRLDLSKTIVIVNKTDVALVAHILERMPEGPMYYPDDVVSDLPEAAFVAELVREQLLAATHDELPYSIATVVTEWEWPRIRCEIIVERESQKGMVIGKGGAVLKMVGTAVRQQLPPGVFIELHVKVDKDWQRKPDRVERLGY
jgi:GTP-binding protein Era